MRKALITGITGQDGSYLAEFLLNKGYEVHGIIRRVALEDPEHRLWRINHIKDKLILHSASLESYASLFNVINKVNPDECYHLGAQSYVHESFLDGDSTFNSNISGTRHLLDALKEKAPKCKVYFAGTSEMFGHAVETPQNEDTPFHPRSPYGISKVAGFHLVRYYREAYGLFACSGILFNHESPRRGFEFVTRKITNMVAKIKLGMADRLELGNVNAKRDWGHSKDYVRAMWLMLQRDKPIDLVIATNETHSVREFVEASFEHAGIKIKWIGEGVNEKGINSDTGKEIVVVNKNFYRPAEVHLLMGDASKAEKVLGWTPKIRFKELVKEMVEFDIKRLKKLNNNSQ